MACAKETCCWSCFAFLHSKGKAAASAVEVAQTAPTLLAQPKSAIDFSEKVPSGRSLETSDIAHKDKDEGEDGAGLAVEVITTQSPKGVEPKKLDEAWSVDKEALLTEQVGKLEHKHQKDVVKQMNAQLEAERNHRATSFSEPRSECMVTLTCKSKTSENAMKTVREDLEDLRNTTLDSMGGTQREVEEKLEPEVPQRKEGEERTLEHELKLHQKSTEAAMASLVDHSAQQAEDHRYQLSLHHDESAGSLQEVVMTQEALLTEQVGKLEHRHQKDVVKQMNALEAERNHCATFSEPRSECMVTLNCKSKTTENAMKTVCEDLEDLRNTTLDSMGVTQREVEEKVEPEVPQRKEGEERTLEREFELHQKSTEAVGQEIAEREKEVGALPHYIAEENTAIMDVVNQQGDRLQALHDQQREDTRELVQSTRETFEQSQTEQQESLDAAIQDASKPEDVATVDKGQRSYTQEFRGISTDDETLLSELGGYGSASSAEEELTTEKSAPIEGEPKLTDALQQADQKVMAKQEDTNHDIKKETSIDFSYDSIFWNVAWRHILQRAWDAFLVKVMLWVVVVIDHLPINWPGVLMDVSNLCNILNIFQFMAYLLSVDEELVFGDSGSSLVRTCLGWPVVLFLPTDMLLRLASSTNFNWMIAVATVADMFIAALIQVLFPRPYIFGPLQIKGNFFKNAMAGARPATDGDLLGLSTAAKKRQFEQACRMAESAIAQDHEPLLDPARIADTEACDCEGRIKVWLPTSGVRHEPLLVDEEPDFTDPLLMEFAPPPPKKLSVKAMLAVARAKKAAAEAAGQGH